MSQNIMIQLVNVSKVVTSGTEQLTILHSVSLEIPRGQFVSVIGPSGSGKSTLLSLIAGLDAPTSGEILLAGHDITQMSEDDLIMMKVRMSMQSGRPEPPQFSKGKSRDERAKKSSKGRKKKK